MVAVGEGTEADGGAVGDSGLMVTPDIGTVLPVAAIINHRRGYLR